MSFSPAWLTLREPVDHRSRDRALLEKLSRHFEDKSPAMIFDLGSGLGSNLRAIAPVLPRRQTWVLVDYDPVLLEAAKDAVAKWADSFRNATGGVEATKDGRELRIEFREHDLVADPAPWGNIEPDLVTAAALFDLVSESWIERFVAGVARERIPFYTALTHDSITEWKPPHPADTAMREAFESHFGTDKGFGPSAGAKAASLMAKAFAASGYEVTTAKSPWVLGNKDKALIGELANGWAGAVRETNSVPEAAIRDWLKTRTAGGTSCTVGHEDLLALPR